MAAASSVSKRNYVFIINHVCVWLLYSDFYIINYKEKLVMPYKLWAFKKAITLTYITFSIEFHFRLTKSQDQLIIAQ